MIKSQDIFSHPITQEYIAVSREMAKYCKINCPEPKELRERYKIALTAYHGFLDTKKVKMPIPKYYWDAKNKKTWKYKDIVVCKDGKGGLHYNGCIINPEWEHRV